MFAAPPDQRPRVESEGTREVTLAAAEELRREMKERGRGWLSAMRLGILRLLLAVGREWQPWHPSGRLSLEEAAAACGLSASQFSHIFRHTMGLSYGSFRARTRLGYAAQLLLTTDQPVECIAEQLGFVDASHLHHAFTKVYGCTPARYRTEGRSLREFRRYTLIESSDPDDPELVRVGSRESGIGDR
jgi:AraC-like DNA-binding protein